MLYKINEEKNFPLIKEKIGLLEKDGPKATDLPILIPKGDDASESDSEGENSTESDFIENKLLEEEEEEEEETLEESDLQKAIERIDVEDKIIEKESDIEKKVLRQKLHV